MVGQEQGYKNLVMGWKACQGFQVPRTFTCEEVSIYAEGSFAELSNKTESSNKNETKTQQVVLVYVEVWKEMSILLASGSVYVNYLNWYDIPLSSTVTFSPGIWYYIIAYTNNGAFNLYYHYDGTPNDQGPAAWNRYGYWETLYVDFFVRYLAEFTISSSRLTQLKEYADLYKPTLWYTENEIYYPCDFYFDENMDIDDNVENYPSTLEEKFWHLRYFVHIQEYAWDNDISEPAIAIEYWYYYVKEKNGHNNDWEVFIIFLKQTNPSQVLRLKAGQHGSLIEKSWGQVEKEGGTHTRLYVDKKHAMYFKKPWWFRKGDEEKVTYSDSRNKPVYVWDTDAIVDTKDNKDKITNWDGDHVWWDDDSKYWWVWKYKKNSDYVKAPWRKIPWMLTEENEY